MLERKRPKRLWHLVFGVIAGLWIAPLGLAADYHPEHPVVVEMVNRAVDYLTSNIGNTGVFYPRAGGGEFILAGYAVAKTGHDASHPVVARGLQAGLELAAQLPGMQQKQFNERITYEASVTVLLLAAVDPDRYRQQLVVIRDWLLQHQRPYGGFGYLADFRAATGDTSQTQYCMLALWTLERAGIEVPNDRILRLLQWMALIQQPSGGWAYQSGPTGPGDQTGMGHSMTAAGMGATLLAADALGAFGRRGAESDGGSDGLPRAFRRVLAKTAPGAAASLGGEDKRRMDASLDAAIRWYQTNNYRRPSGADWFYYLRYSEERMHALLEIRRGQPERSPAWYNAGVEELRGFQASNGGFGVNDRDHTSPGVCTAFAILYLIRSTQQSIGQMSEGLLFGGYSLPKDVSQVRQVGEGLVDANALSSIEDALELLEGRQVHEVQAAMRQASLRLPTEPQQRNLQLDRMARLLASPDPEVRRLAALWLGRGDRLQDAPVLIQALLDRDAEVARQADAALCSLSRRIGGRQLRGDEPLDDERRQAAWDEWQQWYQRIDPEHRFGKS